jgi:hypothetical protein
MRSRFLMLLLLGASVTLAPSEARSQRKERDVITREEILDSPHRTVDLFQAIRSLRPHFLSAPAGVHTRVYPTVVFVDRVRQNGLEALRSIPSSTVERVEYLDPTKSQSQFGSTASGGAVVVTLHADPTESPALGAATRVRR